jgi:hypothetical protein
VPRVQPNGRNNRMKNQMNPGLQEVRRAVTAYLSKMHNKELEAGIYALYIDGDIENFLTELTAAEVGEELIRTLVTCGVRGTFPTFYGIPVVWGCKDLESGYGAEVRLQVPMNIQEPAVLKGTEGSSNPEDINSFLDRRIDEEANRLLEEFDKAPRMPKRMSLGEKMVWASAFVHALRAGSPPTRAAQSGDNSVSDLRGVGHSSSSSDSRQLREMLND